MAEKNDRHSPKSNAGDPMLQAPCDTPRHRNPNSPNSAEAHNRRAAPSGVCRNFGQVHRVRCPATGRKCPLCGQFGHLEQVCPTVSSKEYDERSRSGEHKERKGRNGERNENYCHSCNEKGHYARDCPHIDKRADHAIAEDGREKSRKTATRGEADQRQEQCLSPQDGKPAFRDSWRSAGKRRGGNRRDQEVRCYECGKLGHYRANCPGFSAAPPSGCAGRFVDQDGPFLPRERDHGGGKSKSREGRNLASGHHDNRDGRKQEEPIVQETRDQREMNDRSTGQTGSARESSDENLKRIRDVPSYDTSDEGKGFPKNADHDKTAETAAWPSEKPGERNQDSHETITEKDTATAEETTGDGESPGLTSKRDDDGQGKKWNKPGGDSHREEATSDGTKNYNSQRSPAEGQWYKKPAVRDASESGPGRKRNAKTRQVEKTTGKESTHVSSTDLGLFREVERSVTSRSDVHRDRQEQPGRKASPERRSPVRGEDEENPLMHLSGDPCSDSNRGNMRRHGSPGSNRKRHRGEIRPERAAREFVGKRSWHREERGDYQYAPSSRSSLIESEKQFAFRHDEAFHRLPRNYFDEGDLMELFFRRESPFSQHHPAKFSLDGREFSCTEQYMMYKKAVTARDKETEERILQSTDPAEQKRLGREVRGLDLLEWGQICEGVVFQANWAKFTQNPDLGEKLRATGKKLLVEANPTDSQWGIGLAREDPRARCRKTWRGANRLGYILMDVRHRLPYHQLLDHHFVSRQEQHQHPCSEQQDQAMQTPHPVKECQDFYRQTEHSSQEQWYAEYYNQHRQFEQYQKYHEWEGSPSSWQHQHPYYLPQQQQPQHSRFQHVSGSESVDQGNGLLPPPTQLQPYQQQQQQQQQLDNQLLHSSGGNSPRKPHSDARFQGPMPPQSGMQPCLPWEATHQQPNPGQESSEWSGGRVPKNPGGGFPQQTQQQHGPPCPGIADPPPGPPGASSGQTAPGESTPSGEGKPSGPLPSWWDRGQQPGADQGPEDVPPGGDCSRSPASPQRGNEDCSVLVEKADCDQSGEAAPPECVASVDLPLETPSHGDADCQEASQPLDETPVETESAAVADAAALSRDETSEEGSPTTEATESCENWEKLGEDPLEEKSLQCTPEGSEPTESLSCHGAADRESEVVGENDVLKEAPENQAETVEENKAPEPKDEDVPCGETSPISSTT